MVYEVGRGEWNWQAYISHSNRCQDRYKEHISEYNGGSPKMICLNDMTVICLAKTLALPLVQEEVEIKQGPKKRIANICRYESVVPLWFNDFLRKEKIKL